MLKIMFFMPEYEINNNQLSLVQQNFQMGNNME
jgi:hypothetical protein